MKIIIREYLSLLRESGELDAVLPDLLLMMGIVPESKPKKGVRQYGVDLKAVGVDPDDGEKKVFLFVVKMGNIDRNSWDSTPQSVRPTLGEVVDVYMGMCLDKRQRALPKKIVLCSNGEMDQAVLPNWSGYIDKDREGGVEFSFWGIDRLTSLVDEFLLSESIFPEECRSDFRTTLALLDSPDFTLTRFQRLTDRLLNLPQTKTAKGRRKSLAALDLCVNILFNWAVSANNVKPAYLIAEFALLKTWSWMLDRNVEDAQTKKAVAKILASYMNVQLHYYFKVQRHLFTRDALFGYGTYEIDYRLLVFEQIGMVGLIALNRKFLVDIEGSPEMESVFHNVANGLANLIHNNPGGWWPLFDGHVNDIVLGLLVLKLSGRTNDAIRWIYQIVQRISLDYSRNAAFPIGSDSFFEAAEIALGHSKPDAKLSTMLPILAEWAVVLDSKELYDALRDVVESQFHSINLQIWYPDADIEKWMYAGNALAQSGGMRASIVLPESFDSYRNWILREVSDWEKPSDLSFMKQGLPQIGLAACRHFRTPIPPFYWRVLLEEKSVSEVNAA